MAVRENKSKIGGMVPELSKSIRYILIANLLLPLFSILAKRCILLTNKCKVKDAMQVQQITNKIKTKLQNPIKGCLNQIC